MRRISKQSCIRIREQDQGVGYRSRIKDKVSLTRRIFASRDESSLSYKQDLPMPGGGVVDEEDQ